jgi:hypothetical protein
MISCWKNPFKITDIKGAIIFVMNSHRVIFRIHAVQRMFERQIPVSEVLHVLQTGETIEDHPDDFPYPNRLMLRWRGKRPLHAVAVENASDNETILITAYRPDPGQWKPDFRRRKP